MKKKRNADPLISQIELVLDLGQFITYNQSWDFVHDLEDTKNKIDDLMESGEADRAVRLYEIFLSGCYEKAEEIDDSGGNLGMWLAAGIGLLGAIFAFFIGFVPPAQLKNTNLIEYELFLIIGLLVMSILPHIIYTFTFKHPEWEDKRPVIEES